MKKDSLTKQKKKSIIQDRALSFNKIFVSATAVMRDLHKDCTKVLQRMVRRTLGYFENFFSLEKIMSSKLKKIYGLAAVVTLVAFLAACGGGGGSAPTATCPTGYTLANGVCNPPPTPATGSVTATGCTVPDGASACNISVTWTTANTATPRVTVGGVSVSTLANSGATPGSFSISLGSSTVAVADGTTVLVSVNTFAVCGINSAIVNGVCQPTSTVLHYSDKVYTIHGGGARVQAVTKTGVTEITNKTSFPGTGPFFNCWLPKPSAGILADGKILDACQDVTSLRRHYLALNPVTNEHTEYTGPIPATLQCTENVDKTWSCSTNTDWVAAQSSSPAGAPIANGPAAKVTDGWYFADGNALWVLKFKDTATGIESVIKAGTASVDGTFNVLFTYSN